MPGFLACTLGSQGCAAVRDGEIHEVPGFSVQAVDATAGDVFHGAFAYALFQNWSVHRCPASPTPREPWRVTRLGARGGIPALDEIDALMRRES